MTPRTPASEALRPIVETFKAIGDESRLRILGHLAGSPATVTELAELLELRPPTVSHHLSTLRAAGLVTYRPEGTARVYSFDPSGLDEARRALGGPPQLSAFANDSSLERWERTVLETFTDGETIRQIPSSRKKRHVLVRWLAADFEPGVDYPEAAVNEIIGRRHEDWAFFRRAMVDSGIMTRADGVYRLIPREDEAAGPH